MPKRDDKTTTKKEVRKLSPWNLAMKQAIGILREKTPDLKGPELFRQGAKLAHQLMDQEKEKKKAVIANNNTGEQVAAVGEIPVVSKEAVAAAIAADEPPSKN